MYIMSASAFLVVTSGFIFYHCVAEFESNAFSVGMRLDKIIFVTQRRSNHTHSSIRTYMVNKIRVSYANVSFDSQR